MVVLWRLKQLLVGGVLLLLCVAFPAHAERRVALVIGNSTYTAVPALTNPRNDAADIATELRNLGFEVMLRIDVSRAGIQPMMKEFARLREGADTALVYYAGHGVQYEDSYYLVPVDAALENASDLKYDMLQVEEIRRELANFRGIRIAIYDSCRNDPFKTSQQASVMQPPATLSERASAAGGSIEVFATAPLSVAEDGQARNSPFTRALLKALREPGLDIRRMFEHVADDVKVSTRGLQTPQIDYQLKTPLFLNRSATDRSLWAKIRYSSDPADFRDFLSRFPDSRFAEDARYRLGVIERAHKAVAEFRRKAEERKEQAVAQAREELCRKEAETIELLAASSARITLAALGSNLSCPENAGKVTQAVAALTASEAAEKCRVQVAKIGQLLAEGKSSEIAAIKASPVCGDSVLTANQAIAEIGRRERIELCQRETAQVNALSRARQRDELQRFKTEARCSDTPALIDRSLNEIAAAQAEADRALRETLCHADVDQVARLLDQNRKSDLQAMLQRVTTCPDAHKAADAAVAEIARREVDARIAMCREEDNTITKLLEARRKADLQTLNAQHKCDATSNRIVSALAAIEAQENAEAEQMRIRACNVEAARVKELADRNDRSGLSALMASTVCKPITSGLAKAALDKLAKDDAQRCQAENDELTAIGGRDGDKLKAFEARAKCPDMVQRVHKTIADLAAADAARQVACTREEEALVSARQRGTAGRDQLEVLRDSLTCERLRPMVLASLGSLPAQSLPQSPQPVTPPAQPPVVVDTTDQLRRAQSHLARMGCYTGATSTVSAESVKSALKDYYRVRHVKGDDFAITETVLARLEKEGDQRVCEPEKPDCKRGEHERNGHCVRDAKPRSEAQGHEPRKPAAVADAPRPSPPPAAQPERNPRFCIGC